MRKETSIKSRHLVLRKTTPNKSGLRTPRPLCGFGAPAVSGKEQISSYSAPILYTMAAYTSYFCKKCGSPTPPDMAPEFFEIPAGLLDDSPGIKPDRHIFTDFTPEWDRISDELPIHAQSVIQAPAWKRPSSTDRDQIAL